MENFGSFRATTSSGPVCDGYPVHRECVVRIVDAVAIAKLLLQNRMRVDWRLALAPVAAQ